MQLEERCVEQLVARQGRLSELAILECHVRVIAAVGRGCTPLTTRAIGWGEAGR